MTDAQSAEPKSFKICGAPSNAKIRVLVGRFPYFGDFDQNLRNNFDQLFAANVEYSLSQQADFSVFGLTSVSSDFSRQLIEKAFNIRLPSASVRLSESSGAEQLRTELAASNCQYLLGGRISREGNVLNVEPYVLDVESRSIERPFAPLNGDTQSVLKLADAFAAQTLTYLRRKGAGQRAVEVRCLTWPPALPEPFERAARELSTLVRDQIASSLAVTTKLPIRTSSCSQLSSKFDADIAVVVTGNVSVRLADSQFEVQPKVMLMQPSYERGLAPLQYKIASLSVSFFSKLTSEFAAEVSEFLIAVTPASDDVLSAQVVSGRSDERAALEAFDLLAKDPANGSANLGLGKVLLRKQAADLARFRFLKAKESQDSLTPVDRAELNMALGSVAKEQEEQREYFVTARRLYLELSRNADAARATRGIASALFQEGKKSEAILEMRRQPGLEKDLASLRQLGIYLRLSEKDLEATKVLLSALELKPNDAEARDQLAGAYETLGRKDFVAGRYTDARENFGLAATYHESGVLFYLTGLAAAQQGDYRDAAIQYERMVKLPSDAADLTVAASGWLNLLECYLIMGEYDLLEQRGQDASSFLRWLPDARLLASYIRIVGSLLAQPEKSIESLKKEPPYRDFEGVPDGASAQRFDWSNEQVNGIIAKKVTDADRIQFVEELRGRVWRKPKVLK
ncbi:tetratricopeptide repeat protein [Bradyrhizobium sp. OK095]|uniref:tetratricopeptide repeat protein n=1 Tax=Bradyrhizobium sp. OK095 TaxID=1882760 RepID=UPI00115F8E55|nr:tetratricopeptide repeat protein [Bradyrhizobium sp. OK095]